MVLVHANKERTAYRSLIRGLAYHGGSSIFAQSLVSAHEKDGSAEKCGFCAPSPEPSLIFSPAGPRKLVRLGGLPLTWTQVYDPTGHWWLSTLIAAIPVIVLLGALALLRIKAHWAALIGLASSLTIAIGVFKMPAGMGARTTLYGACYGLFPIGWIILNVIFMYDMNCVTGRFKVLQESLMRLTQDRRLQLLVIAFSFGAFFEGAAGFGTPVAVTAARG